MITIKRGQIPKTLVNASLTVEKYNARNVVLKLHAMQHGKCCYCETKISDEGHEKAVEHFHPKSVFVSLTNDWSNLLLACAQCNGKKSDRFPVLLTTNPGVPKVLSIRPPINERGFVTPRKDSKRGKETIDVTGIYRSCYVQLRRRHLRSLFAKYFLLLDALDDQDLDMLKTWYLALVQCTNAQAEFAALSREFFRVKKIKERFEKLI